MHSQFGLIVVCILPVVVIAGVLAYTHGRFLVSFCRSLNFESGKDQERAAFESEDRADEENEKDCSPWTARRRSVNCWSEETTLVRMTLTMDDVECRLHSGTSFIDRLIFEWDVSMDQQEILELSHQWIHTQDFLTRHMVGLIRVGESALTIEPLEGMVA